MIYASDLDQTLIYSRNSMGEGVVNEDLQLIETLNSKEISFMTHNAISILKNIHEQCLFVPVTTRTIEQYERISLFKKEIMPKYAITSNGGNVLINGVIDHYWHKHVIQRIEDHCLPIVEIVRRFQEIVDTSWFRLGKIADNLFYYAVLERENLPLDRIESFGTWAKQQQWKMSLQGRKLYLVPQEVSKSLAVRYLCEKEGEVFILSSGDSLLDYDLLQIADYALAPSHGEIFNLGKQQNENFIHFVEASGIRASEDILTEILRFIKNMKQESLKSANL
ncbi:HAD family hydrolase [Aneurinibacillus migulanus]|uniref:HAD family hydrolase n=1 Tax=Aneurinibacillus migulanus TaxID=47500 RepID=UPI002E24FCFE|nr:HAD family hydrolase [Aneurinibacillus migulanus]